MALDFILFFLFSWKFNFYELSCTQVNFHGKRNLELIDFSACNELFPETICWKVFHWKHSNKKLFTMKFFSMCFCEKSNESKQKLFKAFKLNNSFHFWVYREKKLFHLVLIFSENKQNQSFKLSPWKAPRSFLSSTKNFKNFCSEVDSKLQLF